MCESVLSLAHPRVISAAAFSPRTGHAIMTTCSDNRLRIWDDVSRADGDPSRELVHSHDFNRYLSPFKCARAIVTPVATQVNGLLQHAPGIASPRKLTLHQDGQEQQSCD